MISLTVSQQGFAIILVQMGKDMETINYCINNETEHGYYYGKQGQKRTVQIIDQGAQNRYRHNMLG